LGIGPDGHTASLVPGDAVLEERGRSVAVTGAYQGFRRMTLTYPVLDAARVVVIVAAGAEKAKAVAAVLRGEQWAPAARLNSPDVRLIVDEAAAGGLK
jgi:6-phosphogluconolactonase